MKKSANKKRKSNKHSNPGGMQEAAASSPVRPSDLGTNFREAEGKVVAYINYYTRPEVCQAVEIQFTDEMFLEFELRPLVQARSAFNASIKGDVSCIRNYGVLPDEH